MCGLMQKLGTRRHSRVNLDATGHFAYAPADNPTTDDHAFIGEEDMPWHGANHVIDTPDCVAAPDYELKPSVPINVLSDGEEQLEDYVMPLSDFIIAFTNRSV
ncbi:hypothetical protein AAG906_038307 [Vitis piasezkii]